MFVKCEEWPRVLADDDGIRPAGEPGVCFYCRAPVGQWHGRECACITKLVLTEVTLGEWRRKKNRRRVGTYQQQVPHHWNDHDVEFHLNESTWCCDNCLDDVVWDDGKEPEEVTRLPKDKCTCGVLAFRFLGVTDEGPFREVRGPVEVPE